MRQYLKKIVVKTAGISMTEITDDVCQFVADSEIHTGHCVVSTLHTSAALLIQENASPDVLIDLIRFFDQIAPKSNNYLHQEEGPDDMPAHIKTAITQTHLTLSVQDSRVLLGTWQGIFLCEFRHSPRSRIISCHLLGE